MGGKLFKIIASNPDYLSADIVAFSLLKQITLNPNEEDVNFIVIEQEEGGKEVTPEQLPVLETYK